MILSFNRKLLAERYHRNLTVALATGNSAIWKPAPSTPLTAIAVARLIQPVLEKNGLPGATAALVCGGIDVGKTIVGSEDIPLGKLVSASIYNRSISDIRSCSELHRK